MVRLNAVRAVQGQLIVLGDDGVNLVMVYPPPRQAFRTGCSKRG